MTHKLIAVDLDGTLLRDDATLSEQSAAVLRQLVSQGHTLLLASGRPYRSMRAYYERLGLHSPLIAYNGAHVFIPGDAAFPELRKRFAYPAVRSIAAELSGKLDSLLCESETTSYLLKEDRFLDQYFPYANRPSIYGPLEQTLKEDVYTLVFKASPLVDPLIQKSVESHPGFCYRHWTASPYSEAYLSGVNKGSALAYILTKMPFAKEDIYAFGDSDNDFEMLELAGHPFALRGCKSSKLQAAFPSTKNGNDHDGVAVTLSELLF